MKLKTSIIFLAFYLFACVTAAVFFEAAGREGLEHFAPLVIGVISGFAIGLGTERKQ